MAPTRAWTHSFRTLGFAYMIIGAIMIMVGIIGINTPTHCTAGGCTYNPIATLAGLTLPSGITLFLAGVIVRWVVSMEIEREDQESP